MTVGSVSVRSAQTRAQSLAFISTMRVPTRVVSTEETTGPDAYCRAVAVTRWLFIVPRDGEVVRMCSRHAYTTTKAESGCGRWDDDKGAYGTEQVDF